MENKLKAIQQISPLMPNSGQIRELRLTMGKEKAAEWLEKIMEASISRYHLERTLTPARRLYEIMKRQGMSQQRLSKISGISSTSLTKYWSIGNGSIPKRRLQEQIASALGVHPNEIWGDGEPDIERMA